MGDTFWNEDRLTDIISPLQDADRLACEQAFTKPSAVRTKEIFEQLTTCQGRLEGVVEEMREYARKKRIKLE